MDPRDLKEELVKLGKLEENLLAVISANGVVGNQKSYRVDYDDERFFVRLSQDCSYMEISSDNVNPKVIGSFSRFIGYNPVRAYKQTISIKGKESHVHVFEWSRDKRKKRVLIKIRRRR